MTLTGPQSKQIQDALLAAFDEAALTQMAKFELNEIREQIAGGDDLTQIVFNLVDWADRNGRVLELINGALTANSDNPQLQKLHTEAQAWQLEPPEAGASPYKGLDFYDVVDADWFFGREALTAQLTAKLCAQRFMIVIGASDCAATKVAPIGKLWNISLWIAP